MLSIWVSQTGASNSGSAAPVGVSCSCVQGPPNYPKGLLPGNMLNLMSNLSAKHCVRWWWWRWFCGDCGCGSHVPKGKSSKSTMFSSKILQQQQQQPLEIIEDFTHEAKNLGNYRRCFLFFFFSCFSYSVFSFVKIRFLGLDGQGKGGQEWPI